MTHIPQLDAYNIQKQIDCHKPAVPRLGEVITEEGGGKQSKILCKPSELPPVGAMIVATVMGRGAAKYPREADGTPNWHKIPWNSNLDHAIEHYLNLREILNQPPMPDDGTVFAELAHTAARTLMALETFALERYGQGWRDVVERNEKI